MSTSVITTQRQGLSGEMWNAILPTYESIIGHPFLQSLADGSLSTDRFRFYVIQDSHYLRGFSRALALTDARARSGDQTVLFTSSASNAIAVEQALHAGFIAELGLDQSAVATTPRTPTTTAYVNFVLANASTGSFAEAVAAVLACYWIYREVGRELIARGSSSPLYQRWIETYGGEEFAATVARVLDVVDEIGTEVGAIERAHMRDLFATGCRYEWMFWDAAWRSETWPI
jgi:thiaminase (transcriptional activator TenA)